MGMNYGSSESNSTQRSQSSSRPTSANELQGYFKNLDQLSGGRLGQYANTGTAQTNYNGLNTDQIRSLGGFGATRLSSLDQTYDDRNNQIARNSALTYAQQQQARQQATNDYTTQKDAINKEVESTIGGYASQEAMRDYQSRLANAGLTARDLAMLAQIYFSGKGTYSNSSSVGNSSSDQTNFGFDLPIPSSS